MPTRPTLIPGEPFGTIGPKMEPQMALRVVDLPNVAVRTRSPQNEPRDVVVKLVNPGWGALESAEVCTHVAVRRR